MHRPETALARTKRYSVACNALEESLFPDPQALYMMAGAMHTQQQQGNAETSTESLNDIGYRDKSAEPKRNSCQQQAQTQIPIRFPSHLRDLPE